MFFKLLNKNALFEHFDFWVLFLFLHVLSERPSLDLVSTADYRKSFNVNNKKFLKRFFKKNLNLFLLKHYVSR